MAPSRNDTEIPGSMQPGPPCLFATGVSDEFAAGVATRLGIEPAAFELRAFEDGEHKMRPLDEVRGQDVYLLHALDDRPDSPVDERLCRLLFFIGTLRDQGAAHMTLICPYLCYSRKDRRTKARDPVTSRYVAELMEAVGVQTVAVLEPHNPAAFENAFRCPAITLNAYGPLADAVLAHTADTRSPLTVVSPDTGGAKRAAAFGRRLAARTGAEPAMAFLDKRRSEGVVSGDTFVGDVSGRTAVIIDDLIASGTTLMRAVDACRRHGARQVFALATHGLFATGAEALFQPAGPDRLFITDSVAPRMESLWGDQLERVTLQPLLADIIAALHRGGSVSELTD